MDVLWLAPAAAVGLVLLALPLLVHLLSRHRSRRVQFPSLRFLPKSQVAALQRRAVSDWPLLLLRMMIVAAAVAAVAAPVFVSDARRAAWQARVARAVIVADEAPETIAIAQDEADTSFVSSRIDASALADGVQDAARWLRDQPPAAREVVIVGDVREGAIAARDFDVLDPHVGIRFLPTVSEVPKHRSMTAVVDDNGSAVALRVSVEASANATTITPEAGSATLPRVQVIAAAAEQAYADALLRAVLREGMVSGELAERAVRFEFEGADRTPLPTTPPDDEWMRQALEGAINARGGAVDGVLVVHPAMRAMDPRAPRLVADVIADALTSSLGPLEARRISPATLARWSRPSGGSPENVLPGDEGDRRWFWGACLGLLAIEQAARRRRRRD